MSHHNEDRAQRLDITNSQQTGLTASYQWPYPSSICAALSGVVSLLSRAGLFLLIGLGFSSASKLSWLLLSVFASNMATLATKVLFFLESSYLLRILDYMCSNLVY